MSTQNLSCSKLVFDNVNEETMRLADFLIKTLDDLNKNIYKETIAIRNFSLKVDDEMFKFKIDCDDYIFTEEEKKQFFKTNSKFIKLCKKIKSAKHIEYNLYIYASLGFIDYSHWVGYFKKNKILKDFIEFEYFEVEETDSKVGTYYFGKNKKLMKKIDGNCEFKDLPKVKKWYADSFYLNIYPEDSLNDKQIEELNKLTKSTFDTETLDESDGVSEEGFNMGVTLELGNNVALKKIIDGIKKIVSYANKEELGVELSANFMPYNEFIFAVVSCEYEEGEIEVVCSKY